MQRSCKGLGISGAIFSSLSSKMLATLILTPICIKMNGYLQKARRDDENYYFSQFKINLTQKGHLYQFEKFLTPRKKI